MLWKQSANRHYRKRFDENIILDKLEPILHSLKIDWLSGETTNKTRIRLVYTFITDIIALVIT